MNALQRICVALIALMLAALLSAVGAQEWERIPPSPAAVEGVRLFEANEYAQARIKLDAAAKANPRDVSVLFWLGRVAMEEDRLDDAAKLFDRVTELAPTSAVAYLWQGRAYGSKAQKANLIKQAGLARKTKNAWEKALALDPDNLEVRGDLVEYYMQAPGIMGGSDEKALAMAEEIRKRDATRGALLLGNVYTRQKKYADAERVYGELRAKNAPLGTTRLVLLYQEMKQPARGFELLDAALRTAPKEPAYLYQYGRLGAMTGMHLDRAEVSLRAYLMLTPGKDDPSLASAQWRLGMVYEAKKEPAKARAAYHAALQLEPKHPQATAALKKLG